MSNSLEIQLINALADVRESIIALTSKKKEQIPTGNWRNGLEVRRFKEGSVIEIYMEYEPNDDISFCWWLEATILPSRWTIQFSVLKDQSSGQEVVEKFPEQTGRLMDGLVAALRHDQANLVESLTKFQV